MSKKLQLRIPDPCHENWDIMTPVEKGRFCGSCQKKVVDFTTMSDREIAFFFKKPSIGSVCGRFMQDQLDRDIEIPKKRIPWVKYFFQFLLPAFLVSARASAQGKVKKEVIEEQYSQTRGQVSQIANRDFIGDTIIIPVEKKINSTMLNGDFSELRFKNFKIEGSVVDLTTSLPIPNATIRIMDVEKFIIADSLGKFTTKSEIYSDKIKLEVSSVGFETKTIECTKLFGEIIIELLPQAKELQEVILSVSGMVRKGCTIAGYFIVSKKDSVYQKVIKWVFTGKDSVNLYPNPVKSGTTLNIEWLKNETGSYNLELFNLSGQLVFRREIWIDEEARLLNIEVPRVTAGNYFLRMTNKKSGKSYTEKIVVQ